MYKMSEMIYNCNYCGFKTKIRGNYESHLRTLKHYKNKQNAKKKEEVVEDNGNKKMENKKQSEKENNKNEEKENNKNEEKQEDKRDKKKEIKKTIYKCPYCNKEYKSVYGLHNHINFYCKEKKAQDEMESEMLSEGEEQEEEIINIDNNLISISKDVMSNGEINEIIEEEMYEKIVLSMWLIVGGWVIKRLIVG